MKNKNIFTYSILSGAVCLALTGCFGGGSSGEAQPQTPTPEPEVKSDPSLYSSVFSSKVNTTDVIVQCGTKGGVEIESGFDLNANKALDADEIDQSHIICNGTDGANGSDGSSATTELNISQSPATLAQCDTGGTTLYIGDEVISLCNAPTAANVADFDKVKAMMNGFQVWSLNLETLPEKLDQDAIALEPSLLVENEAANELLASVDLLALAVELASEDLDGTYNIADLLIAIYAPDFSTITGTIEKAGTDIVVTDATFTTVAGVLVTVTADSIVFNAGLSGGSVTVTGLSASSEAAVLDSVDGSINFIGSDFSPDARLQITLGSETSPLTLHTTGSESFNFEGFIELDTIYYSLGLFNDQGENFKQLRIEGDVSYAGRTLSVTAAYAMENAEEYRALQPSFGDTPLYSGSANIGLSGFVDLEGNIIPDASFSFSANRTGYTRALGSIDLGFNYGGSEFSGHFPNRDRGSAPDIDAALDDIERGSFIFTDNAGGLIRFDDAERYNYSWNQWGERTAGQIKANIYYNGIKYGKIYETRDGDVVIYYSFNDTEELFLSAN